MNIKFRVTKLWTGVENAATEVGLCFYLYTTTLRQQCRRWSKDKQVLEEGDQWR